MCSCMVLAFLANIIAVFEGRNKRVYKSYKSKRHTLGRCSNG